MFHFLPIVSLRERINTFSFFFLYLSIYPSINLFVYMYIYLSIYLSIYELVSLDNRMQGCRQQKG